MSSETSARLSNAIPYLPTLAYPALGGTSAGDETAKVALWPQVLRFMDAL